MPKKPPFSYKLSQRPGRFKLYERSGNEKRHVVNVIVKVGLTEAVAKRLTDRLNSEWRMRASKTSPDVLQEFHKQVLEEARLLLTDPNSDINPAYNRAIVDLTANLLGDADKVVDEVDGIQAYEDYIRNSWGRGSELKVKLEHASELALKLEDLMHGIKEDDPEGLTEGMNTDIEGLAFGIQQLLDGQEYDSDPTHEKLLQEVRKRGKTDEEDPTGGPLPEDEYID